MGRTWWQGRCGSARPAAARRPGIGSGRAAAMRPAWWLGVCLALCLVVMGACLAAEKSYGATAYAGHGALCVKNGKLVDKAGKPFQLKGVSTHGLAWYPQYVNKAAFRTLRDDWKANTVRLALYTEEYGGYCSGGNRKELEKVVDRGVRAASELGMYVIIDWHILADGNPRKIQKEAVAFFGRMSAKYAGRANVLYEICNEPNGGTTWKDVKKYAGAVIPAIRKNAPRAVVLVGTPTWSQDIDRAAADPLKGYGNVMYTFHFYAGTHKKALRSRLEKAVKAGTPVFVSEFGICKASGNGKVNKKSAAAWKKLIRRYGLSYCAWNLSNKKESSALLKSGTRATSGWKTRQLSASGKWVRKVNYPPLNSLTRI